LDYTKKGLGLLAETGEDRSVVDKLVVVEEEWEWEAKL